jgi:hypothetical protein
MQKLVTIYLDSHVYSEGKWLSYSTADKHGRVEEHLTDELHDGWRIVSITGFGGANDHELFRGWLAVVLEK